MIRDSAIDIDTPSAIPYSPTAGKTGKRIVAVRSKVAGTLGVKMVGRQADADIELLPFTAGERHDVRCSSVGEAGTVTIVAGDLTVYFQEQ